jgi:hypothetical protein
MPAILKKKRYRLGGELSVSDADGFPRHFSIGDEMPEDVLTRLSRGEIDAMLGNGMLREIGAPPTPKPAPEPARPLTAAEILRSAGWHKADVVDGRVTGGPRGYAIAVLDKAARESDLKKAAWRGGETPVLVHRVDGEPVATISLVRLASLLAVTTSPSLGA